MMQGSDSGAHGQANPFPPAAANLVSQGWVSVPTSASDKARQNVLDYLAGRTTADIKGRAVAIVGDFGTGKTHLALEMLRELEKRTEGKSTRLYVDAPGDSFVSLYRERFLPQFDRVELRQRVLEYYADVVAEELADSEITSATVTALRTGVVSPELVVERFALAPTRLHRRLAERLQEVTKQPQFATALTLFMRPEYEATVWQWLSTSSPDPVLVERGVTKSIDTDVEALEAIGVIALLYGYHGHQFALALDELEKILVPLAQAEGGSDVIQSLKRLIHIFTHTGALLILCGLPDYFDLLPDDTKQRLSDVIRPTRLSGDDTRRYIEESQSRAFGSPKLAPFTTDSTAYIASIAAGNPRRIIRLCYLLYRAAGSQDVPITRALVREVAKEQFETFSIDDIANDLTGIFDRNGWLFERQKQLTKTKTSRVDFWLPIATDGAGCAVLLTKSILDQAEARKFANRATTIAKVSPEEGSPIEIFVVVNGRIADEASDLLSDAPVRLFEYGLTGFSDAIEAALKGAFQRFERSRQEVTLVGLGERIEQLGRQVSSLYRAFDEFAAGITRREFESAAELGLRRVFASLSEVDLRIPARYTIVRHRWQRLTRIFDTLRDIIESQNRQVGASYRPQKGLEALDSLSRAVDEFELRLARILGTSSDANAIDRIGEICSRADDDLQVAWRRASEDLAGALETASGPSSEMRHLEAEYLELPRDTFYAFRDELKSTRPGSIDSIR